ncbi:transcription factor 7-like 2 isoform X2 [Cynoglossus semilaevis]|uniref:transcription factor 7-like 2 isoform X2 n=1 Tax=Cynoglossus semilaevis TaxID=244447 RepID=UPI0004977DA7|nr:transcription factor 7-like 2 isoform X2 [Cynoglossus semilaevis]
MRGYRDRVTNNRFSMDLDSVFHRVIDQMDEKDLLDTAHAIYNEVLAAAPNPPPHFPLPRRFLPPLFPPHLPAHPPPLTYAHAAHAVGYGCDPHPPPVRGWNDGYDGYVPENVPFGLGHSLMADQMLTVERPATDSYYADDISDDTDACQGQDVQLMTLPQNLGQNLGHHLTPTEKVGEPIVISDEDTETEETPFLKTKPPSSEELFTLGHVSDGDKNHPYVKKPPNAFMLYMKDQRASIVAQLDSCDNALVNTVLGKRWRSLSDSEQARYHDMAENLKKLHAEKYPWWSSRQNYGKKRKRIRRRNYPIRSNEPPSPPFIDRSYSPSTSQTK